MDKFKSMFKSKRSSKQFGPADQTTNASNYGAQYLAQQPVQYSSPTPQAYASTPQAPSRHAGGSNVGAAPQQHHHLQTPPAPTPAAVPAHYQSTSQQQQQRPQQQHQAQQHQAQRHQAQQHQAQQHQAQQHQAQQHQAQQHQAQQQPAIPTPVPAPAPDEPYSFTLKLERGLWPPLEVDASTENLLAVAGKIHLDFTERLATSWAHGQNTGGRFGNSLFAGSSVPGVVQLPPLLFDLVQYRVVRAAELGKVTYAAISHVWGHTTNVDGSRYGVPWDIPIESEARLLQILEATRVVVGERYVWMDVLCLDQRSRNEAEISQMKSYFANATGCFVWLDNSFGDPGWDEVLNAIEHINAMYKQDKHGTPLPGVLEELVGGGSLFNLQLNEQDCIAWIRRMTALGNAPWFRRVWTLQEGIIPDSVYFCTPERYMFSGTSMWQLSAVIEMLASSLLRDQGGLIGTAFAHDLQRSEIHKMLKLRQLYRSGGISYWHLNQAVRTRYCKFEQDRVLGVLGLVHRALPVVSYHRTVNELYQDLYRAYLSDRDFKACMFLGGQSQLPDFNQSVGIITSELQSRQESHVLEPVPNGLYLNNVGYDFVTRMNCHFATGKLDQWPLKFQGILEWTAHQQQELARAFNLPDELHAQTGLCPGALSAYTAITGRNISADSMNELAELWKIVQANEPVALLEWIRTGSLLLADLSFDSALVLLVTQSRDSQLAVLTEEVDDLTSLITLMPASYQHQPGAGCIVGRLLPNGEVKKIGVGFGRNLRCSGIARFTLVD